MDPKTKLVIIEETAAFYNLNNRSLTSDGGGCEYRNRDGNMCAVGRCMSETGIAIFGSAAGFATSIHNVLLGQGKGGIDFILKDEYKGHCIEFWQYLQRLHDNKAYWNAEGLTQLGKNQVQYIIKMWGDK